MINQPRIGHWLFAYLKQATSLFLYGASGVVIISSYEEVSLATLEPYSCCLEKMFVSFPNLLFFILTRLLSLPLFLVYPRDLLNYIYKMAFNLPWYIYHLLKRMCCVYVCTVLYDCNFGVSASIHSINVSLSAIFKVVSTEPIIWSDARLLLCRNCT